MTGHAISQTSEWAALREHAKRLRTAYLRELLAADPHRPARFTVEVGDLAVDCSRHLATPRTLELLAALADRADVAGRVSAMLNGEPVNITENAAALHAALRSPSVAERAGVAPVVAGEFDKMAGLSQAVRSGQRRGANGKRITTVVNLGIGGSHLGMMMAYEALAAFRQPGINVRFASNIDPADLADAVGDLDAAQTLFVVVSKSFTTAETLANMAAARAWVVSAVGEAGADQHFVSVTANPRAASDAGIADGEILKMWDWVGGRFSLGSTAGLSLMIAIGEASFREMLAGMRAVDDHLITAPPQQNAPLLMGLLAVWYRNFWDLPARVVLPYSQRLQLLPAYLQQLHMESNGKQVTVAGTPVDTSTSQIVWGAAGTGGQHSFHQFLHQGTTVVPADFIVFARPDRDARGLPGAAQRHEALVANCLAQAATLALGAPNPRSDDPQAAHRTLVGNRPSTVIMAPELTPGVLGQLVALYEHETVVQGAVWGINSFDQFGVQHAKTAADHITAGLRNDSAHSAQTSGDFDHATATALRRYLRLRGG